MPPGPRFDLDPALAKPSDFVVCKGPSSSHPCYRGGPYLRQGRNIEVTNNISRRTFMVGAATAAAALRVGGANDRIRLGIIGSGQRGQYLMTRANEAGNIEWVAISDIYDARRDQAEKVANTRVDEYANYHQIGRAHGLNSSHLGISYAV